MAQEPQTTEAMEVGGGRRLSLSRQGVLVESRGSGGAWVPVRAVGYDEIHAVYAYEARDWGFLGASVALWLGLVFLLLVAALAFRWSAPYIGFGVLAVSLVTGALAAYRISRVPRRLLKIDAVTGPLTVPNRAAGFFASLAARLPAPEEAPLTPPAVANPPGAAGAAPAPAPPAVPPASGRGGAAGDHFSPEAPSSESGSAS